MSTTSLELWEITTPLGGQYGACIAATLLIYDWIFTFRDEWDLIWLAKWTPGKVIFIFIRYSGFIDMIGWFYLQFGHPITAKSCTVVLYLVLYTSGAMVFGGATLVLALRTWAIWNRSLLWGIVISVVLLAVSPLSLVFVTWITTNLLHDGYPGYPELVGCGITDTAASASAGGKLFVCLSAYEGLIFILTVVRGYSYINERTSLTFILYRDALLASTCFLTMNISLAVISYQNSPMFYLPFLLCSALYCVLPCRIILNLRKATTRLDGWDVTTVGPALVVGDAAEWEMESVAV
ncbi:hypothetical protein CALVIDRAFT_532835 [Calocera viscosa TUFC12733]|uniref:DUF6533 domain-containing protein n=1 Tax=Calocera viscosa (strain TUFC12733) TaxID=1330018 RepID=A0A167RS68_CALVF|nr:hypothetical protein CALVIDRAFT_532835 [Calocera viscosa TUFC12733]